LRTIGREDLSRLIAALRERGYTVIGPTARDGAVVLDEIASDADLPIGWTDVQEGATYRLRRRGDAVFGFAVGPTSWKRFLDPPRVRLWRAERDGKDFRVVSDEEPAPRYAFFGARSCDLHAIAIQDRVHTGGPYADPAYAERREGAFVVAVNCGKAGGTCFCVSMNTGPKATLGFDLALTEVVEEGRHYFTVEVGTERGEELLGAVSHRDATDTEAEAAGRAVARAAAEMGRSLDTDGIKELFYRNQEHPRWRDVASRCLTCGTCTMVCPTCFCHSVEDASDLTGEHAERWRRWESCFTTSFSYIHGGSVRQSTESRYRHWITHKLATWYDQFGTSGCVGCGRCITWCPVAIDITEEAAALRASEAPRGDDDGNA
jgi:ferredoxin